MIEIEQLIVSIVSSIAFFGWAYLDAFFAGKG